MADDSAEQFLSDVDAALAGAAATRPTRPLDATVLELSPDESDATTLVEGTVTVVVGEPGSPFAKELQDAAANGDTERVRSLLETFSAQFSRALLRDRVSPPGMEIASMPSLVDVSYGDKPLARGVMSLPGVDAAVARTLWNGGRLDAGGFTAVEHPLSADQPPPSVTVLMIHPNLSALEQGVLERIPDDLSSVHLDTSPYAFPAAAFKVVGLPAVEHVVNKLVDHFFENKGADNQRNVDRIEAVQQQERAAIDQAQARERNQIQDNQEKQQQQIDQRQQDEQQQIDQRQQRERDQLEQAHQRQDRRQVDDRERAAQQGRQEQEQEQQAQDQAQEQERIRQRQAQEQDRLTQEQQQERERQQLKQQQERGEQQRKQEAEKQQASGGLVLDQVAGLQREVFVPQQIEIFAMARGLRFDRDALQRRVSEIDFDQLEPTASAQTLLRLRGELVDIGLP